MLSGVTSRHVMSRRFDSSVDHDVRLFRRNTQWVACHQHRFVALLPSRSPSAAADNAAGQETSRNKTRHHRQQQNSHHGGGRRSRGPVVVAGSCPRRCCRRRSRRTALGSFARGVGFLCVFAFFHATAPVFPGSKRCYPIHKDGNIAQVGVCGTPVQEPRQHPSVVDQSKGEPGGKVARIRIQIPDRRCDLVNLEDHHASIGWKVGCVPNFFAERGHEWENG